MWCPECRGEWREGIVRCLDCDVELVASEPPARGNPDAKLVTVFRTAEADVLPVVRSLLEESGIPFAVKGEELVGMFPSAGLGLVIDPRSRAAEIQVTEDRADEARELLADVVQEHPVGDSESD
jgi:hypothetical protein